jgi:hypothetical protein
VRKGILPDRKTNLHRKLGEEREAWIHDDRGNNAEESMARPKIKMSFSS